MPVKFEKRNGTSIANKKQTQVGKCTKRSKAKGHNMDKMLAQLVLLDTALEEKKKDKNRETFKQSKGVKKRDAKIDEEKKKSRKITGKYNQI